MRYATTRDRRRLRTSALLGTAMLMSGCPLAAAASPAAHLAAARGTIGPYAVPALRQPLTTNAKSTVAHDTETEALVAHSGRLFAATGQWEYPGPSAFGQVLVKKSKTSPWTVFEQTQSLRVQALDSFSIPSDQGARARSFPPGHPSHRRWAIEDPVVARRRQVLLVRQFVRSPSGR